MDKLLETALQTLRESRAAEGDALRALEGEPAYIGQALSGRVSARDLERLALVLPHCPRVGILPDRVHPFEVYGRAALCYSLPTEGYRERLEALREQHPPVALVSERAGSLSHRPATLPGKERAEVTPVADFILSSRPVASYTAPISIVWYSELAPGLLVKIEATAGEMIGAYHPLCSRVRWAAENDHDRVRPENRKWRSSWTWGSGSRVTRWWTSPGERSPLTWTWEPGTTLEHALSEG